MVQIESLVFDQRSAVVYRGVGGVWAVRVRPYSDDDGHTPIDHVPVDFFAEPARAVRCCESIRRLHNNTMAKIFAGVAEFQGVMRYPVEVD